MRKLLMLVVVISAFTACQPSADKLNGRITAMETRLFAPSAQAISKASADSLISDYELFVADYPKDSLAPAYLFKAAGMAMNTGDGARAITFFDRMAKEYPANPKAALALFFKGYVQENILRNIDQAKETYLLFLEKFPDNEFADDAKASIENLGKTPEQMIREFEAKNKADSAAAKKK